MKTKKKWPVLHGNPQDVIPLVHARVDEAYDVLVVKGTQDLGLVHRLHQDE